MSEKATYKLNGNILMLNPLQGFNLPDYMSPLDPNNPIRKRWQQLWEKDDFDPQPIPPAKLRNVRIGMITNLLSGKNKNGAYSRIAYENLLAHTGIVRESGSLKNLSEIIHEFRESGVNVIIVNGGDGTMGAVATEVFHTWEGEMPAFVPLRGGTMNATANALGVPRTSSAVVLDRFVRMINAHDEGLVEQWIGTIRVSDPRRKRDHYGFTFMEGIPYEYDRYIYSLGGTSQKNSAFALVFLTLHGFFGTRLSKEIWRAVPAEITIEKNPVPFKSIRAVVASTIANLPLGLKPFPTPPPAKERKFSYLVSGISTKDMVKYPFAILRGKYSAKDHLTGHAGEITIRMNNGYALDGELWAHDDDVTITVSSGLPLKIWWFATPAGFLW